jgi:hypothetical protein
VVGHDDEGVEFVVSFGAVVLKGFDEEFGVAFDLKEAATIVGCAGDEEGSGARCRGSLRMLLGFCRLGVIITRCFWCGIKTY